MGKTASTLGRRATRPLKEFNLEERVAKELRKEKRSAAPRHQTTAAIIEEAVRDQPKEVKQSLEEKDDMLLERLRSVYVTSEDVTPEHKTTTSNPERPLPRDRTVMSTPDYGYFEPKSVPYGKVTLRDAIEVIKHHQENPKLWTAKKLADEYRLSAELTEKVLRYFRLFELVVPANEKAKDATRALLHSTPLIAHTIKQLPASEGTEKEKDKKS